jgi:hypothetical protein
MEFDLISWYRHRPADSMCENCRAVYVRGAAGESSSYRDVVWKGKLLKPECRVCGLKVDQENESVFVRRPGDDNEPDLYELAAVAASLPPTSSLKSFRFEPLASLFKAINAARWFIHFTTYSLDSTILGALRMASHRAQVRGIVGKLNDFDQRALESMNADNPADVTSDFLILSRSSKTPMIDGVHSKLIIIDGVLAIKGSANLTVNGFIKAGKDSASEIVEAVSVPNEVLRLNNTYFARHWGENTPQVTVESFLPF